MNLGDLGEDDLLYDSLEDERELCDGRAADDDAQRPTAGPGLSGRARARRRLRPVTR